MAGSLLNGGRMATRTITAIVGGYAAAAASASLLARILPIDRAEATIWAMILSFLPYAGIILWAFHETRLLRVVGVVWGTAIGSTACVLLLGPAL